MLRLDRNERRVARLLPWIIIATLLLLLLASLQVDHQRLRQEFTPTPVIAPAR